MRNNDVLFVFSATEGIFHTSIVIDRIEFSYGLRSVESSQTPARGSQFGPYVQFSYGKQGYISIVERGKREERGERGVRLEN
jgi:hypothetical protein